MPFYKRSQKWTDGADPQDLSSEWEKFVTLLIFFSTKPLAIGIPLSRRQFPVKLAFAMSITKSQGQSLEKVGVTLKEPVFSHGMLYVALSRCTSMDGVRVETMPSDGNRAINIVEQAVL